MSKKKYLVIGNPIDHSLSPLLHNYWIKKSNIEAVYEKQKMTVNDLKSLFLRIQKLLNTINDAELSIKKNYENSIKILLNFIFATCKTDQ